MASINLKIILFLLTIILAKLSKSDGLIVAKQDIVHPTSDLILQYKSDYRPANKIVTLTAAIPMGSRHVLLPSNLVFKTNPAM